MVIVCVLACARASLFAIAFSFIRQASYSKDNRLKFCHFVVPCSVVALSVHPVTTVPLHYAAFAQSAQLIV
jgi:hypothetical protein